MKHMSKINPDKKKKSTTVIPLPIVKLNENGTDDWGWSMTFLISLLKLHIADIGLLEYDGTHLVNWHLPTYMVVPYARRL